MRSLCTATRDLLSLGGSENDVTVERNREVQRGNRFLGEETGGGGKMIISVLDALFVLLSCFVWFL